MSNGCNTKIKRKKLAAKFHQQRGVCYYCARPILLQHGPADARLREHHATLDHIIPRSRGGTYANDNLVAACFACNNQRGERDARRFLLEKQGAMA